MSPEERAAAIMSGFAGNPAAMRQAIASHIRYALAAAEVERPPNEVRIVFPDQQSADRWVRWVETNEDTFKMAVDEDFYFGFEVAIHTPRHITFTPTPPVEDDEDAQDA